MGDGLVAFNVGYRVSVGDLRRMPHDIHRGAKSAK
jgi:hypothetical protein